LKNIEHNIPHIISKKIVFKGKYLNFVVSEYSDSSGIIRQWEYFERVNCKGIVVIVPVTDNNELILIKQFRPPLNRYVIEFPAGLNDKGGTLEQAALRELEEETGYTAKEIIHISEGPMSSGSSGEIITVYLARKLIFKGISGRDETEDIEVLIIPSEKLFETLEELKTQGNLIDLKIYGFFELAMRFMESL
jgi:8-oxo-dGTP pyrophosphatase MutT (NUDIX family)